MYAKHIQCEEMFIKMTQWDRNQESSAGQYSLMQSHCERELFNLTWKFSVTPAGNQFSAGCLKIMLLA